MRQRKPQEIVEIGSGVSTRVLAAAARANAANGASGHYRVIDPFPGWVVAEGVPGVDKLVTESVESQPIEMFLQLAAGDVLFIDGTHVLKAGGDVEFLFLEVIPRLKPGVAVQVHDVYLPFDYPPQNYEERWFWTEQYLLRALLTGNRSLRVLWSSFALFRFHPDQLNSVFQGLAYPPYGGPCSLWFEVVAEPGEARDDAVPGTG